MKTIKNGVHYHHHPRSALEPLHEPLFDPRDGRGAYSPRHTFVLRQHKAAMQGNLKALAFMLKMITRKSEAALKAVRGKPQWAVEEGRLDWPSLLPVMELLGMVTVERKPIPPTSRQLAVSSSIKPKEGRYVHFADWLQEAARTHSKRSRRAETALDHWLGRNSLDARQRSEESRMD